MTRQRGKKILSYYSRWDFTNGWCYCTEMNGQINELHLTKESKCFVLSQQTLPDQGQSSFSSWLDTLPSGIKGAVGVDCAGAVGLAAGAGLAVSRVLVCCLSFCQESSCGSLRGPISLVGTGVLCCCDAGEDPHAKRKRT